MWRPYRPRDDLLGLTWGDAPGWYRLSHWDKWMMAGGGSEKGEVRREKGGSGQQRHRDELWRDHVEYASD